jgi:pSer/pThr/pTyr-binding forkhead associated (FHA) protein
MKSFTALVVTALVEVRSFSDMPLILEAQTGPHAGRQVILHTGRTVQVGRSRWANLSLPDDTALSAAHFELECGRDDCRLRDLDSAAGTRLNGTVVQESAVTPGDVISAGRTTFIVRGEDRPLAAPSLAPVPVSATTPPALKQRSATPPDRLLQVLRGQAEPLFALLDAAREPKVLELLRGSGEEHRSLYEGPKGEELANWAPYVVRLPAHSRLLEALARESWGKCWGVYFTSARSLAEVRKHFRHFLMAKLADGRDVYFRFYDPRVLRVYLASCDAAETTQFFGPIGSYLMEAKEPATLLRFRDTGRGAGREVLSLTVPKLEEALR